jgi:hypothetical protein
LIEDLSLPAEVTLRPLFDLLWNAFGYEQSFSFNKAGELLPV